MIGIINYRAGNSISVQNACEKLGIESRLISQRDDFDQTDKIILPGVGSARETMNSLAELGIIDILEKKVLEDKVPFLGICVGMQIIFEHSEEGNTECLGWLKGNVRRFDPQSVRVPQIGWNKITWEKAGQLNKGQGISDNDYFYFVNSYYVVPDDYEDVLATAVYGDKFTAMVERGNIFASQCHVEKSAQAGFKVLKNFSAVEGGKI